MKHHFIALYFAGWMLYAGFSNNVLYHGNPLMGLGMGLLAPGILVAELLPSNIHPGITIFAGSGIFWILLWHFKGRRSGPVVVSPATPKITRIAWGRRTRSFTER